MESTDCDTDEIPERNTDEIILVIEDDELIEESKDEMSLEESFQLKLRGGSIRNTSQITKSKKDLLKIIRAEMRYFETEELRGKYLQMVYDYLMTVPPTSVDAERAFSAAGQLVTKIRSQLFDESIDTLCLLRAYFVNEKNF